MIFRPELAKLVLQRRKTQTRRVATTKTCRYQAGRSYAVQPGRGKTASARITVIGVRLESLGEITLKDAKREGFVTRDEFFDYWREMHGSASPDLQVWVITFVLGDHTDLPRLLAARPGPPHGDYVTDPHFALPHEPEAISARQAEGYAKLATVRTAQRSADPLLKERDKIARSLKEMRQHLGQTPDREISKTIRALEHQLASLDRKLKAA